MPHSEKNAPSAIAMTLAMVSMIGPADAKQVFDKVIRGRSYTCNTDSNMNPQTDCLSSIAILCNTTDRTWDSTKKANCQTEVNMMFENMNTHWQNVRRDCGHWPFTQNGIRYTGVYPSEKCSSANKNLIANAKARNPLSIRQVTQDLTQDQTTTLYLRLWENTVLKDIVRDSPECSSVVLSWQLMGQTTSVSSTSATDCCYYLGTTTQIDGIPGVTCTSTGNVTGINWGSQALRNSIPTEIGTLPNLLQL